LTFNSTEPLDAYLIRLECP